MTQMIQKLIFAAAAAALTTTTLVASSAQAQTAARTVSYADLNLKADAGKATFAARVRTAAEAVCATGGQSIREMSAVKKCIDNAVETAMTKAASIS